MYEADWQLYESYKQTILKAVVAEINVTQRVPVRIMELILTRPMQGILKCSEPRRLFSVPFALRLRKNEFNWQINNGPEWYRMNLAEYNIDPEQIKHSLSHFYDWAAG